MDHIPIQNLGHGASNDKSVKIATLMCRNNITYKNQGEICNFKEEDMPFDRMQDILLKNPSLCAVYNP